MRSNTDQIEYISWKWLQAYREGLIAITPGEEGKIEQYVRAGKIEEAQAACGSYSGRYLEVIVFISLCKMMLKLENSWVKRLVSLPNKFVPLVATNDVQLFE